MTPAESAVRPVKALAGRQLGLVKDILMEVEHHLELFVGGNGIRGVGLYRLATRAFADAVGQLDRNQTYAKQS